MGASTLEFFLSNEKIWVQYNLERMPLEEFLQLDGSRALVQKICRAIRTQFPAENRCTEPKCPGADRPGDDCQCGAIVGKFIRAHFLKRDKTYDLMVSENSDYVRFFVEGG